uniref:chorismate mutase n=1 Tax=Aequoribacter sp. TaxID=2847771 RepID=UPI003F69F509
MRKPRNITVLLFCLLTSLTSFANNDSEQTLYQLMSERLALMPEVAKYKWHHNLPIEDLAREAIVLERTVSRTTVLDPIHTRTFFGLQITAAKAIQANVFQSLTNRD